MFRLFIPLFALCLLIASTVCAETTPVVSPLNLTQINKELSIIEKTLKNGTSGKQTSKFIQELGGYREIVAAERLQNATDLAGTQKKMEALGEAPVDGATEPAELAKQRKAFTKEADTFKSAIANMDLTLTKIEDLNQKIMQLRNQNLFDQLTVKTDSILNFKTFWASIVSFSTFLYEIMQYPIEWFRGLNAEQKAFVEERGATVGLWSAAGIFLTAVVSWFIRRRFGYKDAIEKPNYSQKVSAALFVLFARGLMPAAILGLALAWLYQYETIFSGPFGLTLRISFFYMLYLFLSTTVVSVLFTPNRPAWRLIEVNDQKAKRLSFALVFSIVIVCVFSFFQALALRLDYSNDTIFAIKTIANGVKAFCIILVANRFLYNDKDLTDEELAAENVQSLSMSSKLSVLIALGAIVTFAFSLAGYVRLSEFIFNRFITSVVIVGLFYIIRKLVLVLVEQVLSMRVWAHKFRITKSKAKQIVFWISFIITPILFAFGGLILLAVWGVSVDILLQKLKVFLTGFNIGGMRVSIVSLLMGLGTFLFCWYLTYKVKNSLLSGALSNIQMDSSTRNSLAAGVGFLGIIASLLAGITVIGGSLQGLAIIAGALSFGAGLGLQNVVNNFVSGIILLFERPVRIGDAVIINGHEGVVKQINMRSTQLETYNKTNVIIPNADLLSNSLVNMTYKNRQARVDINVGVSYDSDVERVQEVLLDIAKSTKHVSTNPAPIVLFTDLADSSLNFQLRCYTSDISNKSSISNTVRAEIIKRFRAEKIDIPFPQRVVHLATPPEPQKAKPKKKARS